MQKEFNDVSLEKMPTPTDMETFGVSPVKLASPVQIYSEFGNWPSYRWYRNPIKWWKWRKAMRAISKHAKEDQPWITSDR